MAFYPCGASSRTSLVKSRFATPLLLSADEVARLALFRPVCQDAGALTQPSESGRNSTASELSHVEHHYRQIRRRDAADAAGLAEVRWPNARQFLLGLGTQLRHGSVVEVQRDGLRLQPLEALHLKGLAVDVTRVLGFKKHLLH